MVVKDIFGAIGNHRKMARTIEGMDLSFPEKQFLRQSIKGTHTYEISVLGPMQYQLGGGKAYRSDALKLTGDYLFFTRVMDNVIDGHKLNGEPMDYNSRDVLLYGIVDYLSDVSDETELRRVVPKKGGGRRSIRNYKAP
jgi:hypothetical protein